VDPVDHCDCRLSEEALQRLLVEDFSLALLDVRLPRMDGFEVARLIRARTRRGTCRSFS
jgi:CheY-like chemotaxis protein